MTENTPLPVKGYTGQSDENVALANEGKELEERYKRVHKYRDASAAIRAKKSKKQRPVRRTV